MDYARIIEAVNATQATEASKLEAAQLLQGWIQKWHPVDRLFTVLHSEAELVCWLSDTTVVVGRSDLIALDETKEGFFGEWKSANPNKKKEWKLDWRLSPQALTYAVATRYGCVYDKDGPLPLPFQISKFLVRLAFKSSPPGYDFEWFTYTDQELDFWRDELLRLADRVREYRINGHVPWSPNFTGCLKYGPKYPCPFFGNNCSKLDFTSAEGFVPRSFHLQVEKDIATSPDLVVLDATRVETWLRCPEKYRRENEDNLTTSDRSPSLDTGTALHAGLREYYQQLKEGG